MSLFDYIPTSIEVNQCIKPEAEGAHEAVLLAVHQPSPLSYRAVNSQAKVATDENKLFDHLLTQNTATGALVVPITGISGVGKSHLIRLLDARLRSSSEERYLIIRIPKSASLRRVVELILEPLPKEEYASVKSAFANALSEVDVETAAIRFQGELEIALRRKAEELREELRAHPSVQLIREQLDHALRLPQLLRDPITAEHFRETVFPRIVQRAVAGSHSEQIDPTQGQFSVTDLVLPNSIDLGQAAKPVANYYRVALEARGGHGMNVAVDVLNKVVDQATRQLFNLQDALGGMTLQDVILEIRRLLLKEKRDLILLVEDFAALTGIQETLANVLIQEGVRDGIAQYATMRSVIAVTDGYLVGRQTLATRAMGEWIVESKIQSEEEILNRTRALVASYLNAARWGEEALIDYYTRRGRAGGGTNEWLPVFRSRDDQDSDRALGAFGSEREVPLFPFTAASIECLARNALKQGDSLVFNPRFIINDVLRRVLLPARDAFEAKRFPGPGMEFREPSADVAQWLASLRVSDETRQRFKRVAVVWGNNPESRTDLGAIPKEVFEAFGLDSPGFAPVEAVRRSENPPAPPPSPTPPDDLVKWKTTLEDWVHPGTLLPQQVANTIRKALSIAINERIDWNAERCLSTPIQPSQVSIPNAAGEGRVQTNSIQVASDNRDPDGRLRSELLSLLRATMSYAGRADYDEYEEDLARIGNLVDRLLPQALNLIRSGNIRQSQLAMLVLSANGRVLGLLERGRTPKAVSSLLFGDVQAQETLPEDAKPVFCEWRSLQQDAVRIRARLNSILIATCGCFQGTGHTPQGVDIIRLVEHYPSQDVRLDLPSLDRLTSEERQSLTAMSDARVAARLRVQMQELSRIREEVIGKLGIDFDKQAITNAIKDLAEALRAIGAWNTGAIGFSPSEFTKLCEEFRSAALKESLDQLGRNNQESEGDGATPATARLAQVKIVPLLVAERFVRHAELVTLMAERHAATLENQHQGVDPAAQAQSILQLLDALRDSVEELEQGRQDAIA